MELHFSVVASSQCGGAATKERGTPIPREETGLVPSRGIAVLRSRQNVPA
jgi:hypothetical protein